jgi:DNA-directed RNA polymerase beta subunit
MSILNTLPRGMRSVDDVRAQIAREGLDPKLLIVPPPLAVDSDLSENAREKIHDMTFDSLTNPGTRQEESRETQLVRSFFHFHGSFIPDLIESYNAFIRGYSVKDIINIKPTNLRCAFNNVRFTRPTVIVDGKVVALYPQAARSVHSYMTHIFVDMQKYSIDSDGTWTAIGDPVKNIQIGAIPVMVRSILCRTYGLTRDELLAIGEDPTDPGGYYIVRGSEKTIPLSDTLRENRYLLLDKHGEEGKECISTTRANPSKASIVTKLLEYNGMIRVNYTHYPSPSANTLRTTMSRKDQMSRMLNCLQIFRIFGIQDDPQVIVRRYILRFVRPQWQSVVEGRLASSVYNLMSQGDYLSYVISKFEDIRDSRQIVPGDGLDDMRKRFVKTLRDCFLSHMASDPDEPRLLCYGLMIARFVEYLTGLRHSDDLNDYGKKRLVNSAERIERLLLKTTRRLKSTVEKDIENAADSVKTDVIYIARRINSKIISDTFETSFSTNIWGTAKDPRPEENITEPLNRASHAAVLAHLTKISAHTSSNNRDLEIRSVQPSQLNYVCPSDTPERLRVGLVKHRAVGCITSLERSEIFLEILTKPFLAKSLHEEGTILLLNGRYMGTVDGKALYTMLLTKRRNGTLDYDTMIVLDEADGLLYLHNDPSRPIAPYLIVNTETENLVIEEKNLWGKPFKELLINGAVEYVDAFEQGSIKLATDYGMLGMSKTVMRDFLAEHTRLTELKEQIMSGNAPDVGPEVSAAEDEVKTMTEQVVELQARVQDLAAQKKTWYEADIGPEEVPRLEERTREVNRIRLEENEALIVYGKANADLGRKQRSILTLRSAYTLAVVNDELTNLEGKIAKETSRRRYTHCMLSPDTLYSFAASIIPAAGMQLATRVSYHCSKGIHSLGIYSGTYPIRMDTASKVQTWPSRPIFSSHMVDILGMGDLPQGETVLIAIMPWGGHNQEDALIMSQGAADRGLFAHTLFHLLTSTLLKGDNYIEAFSAPPSREGKDAFVFGGIGDDGLPKIGYYLREGQRYAYKVRKTHGDPKPQYIAEPIGFTQEGMVERIILGVNHDGHTFARIKLRQTSNAVTGTKLVMRVAMKGTISRIVKDEDMPYYYAKDGTKIRPDLILNPHSIPSRMSIGLLAEILLSKVAAMTAKDIDATSFKKLDMDGAMAYLKAHGMDPYGREQFFNPVTHKPIETLIMAGFAYAALLPAIPGLKIQARNRGARRLLTRQPSRGADASQSTGMRIGTQERDALISHGASEILRERLCTASDEHTDIYCEKCGKVAQSNINTGVVSCPHCGDDARFGKCTIPWAFKTLSQLLEGAGISIKFGFEAPEAKAARIAAGLPPPDPMQVPDIGVHEESEEEPDVEEKEEAAEEESPSEEAEMDE